MAKVGYNALRIQYKTYVGAFPTSAYVDNDALAQAGYTISNSAPFDEFKTDKSILGQLTLSEVKLPGSCELQRKIVHLKTMEIPEKRLKLKFE